MSLDKAEPLAEFKASISGNLLRAWFEAMLSLVDEARITVSRSGFHAKIVDPAHVSMLDTRLKRPSFAKLTVKKSGEFGLDLDKILAILKEVKKGDLVHLQTVIKSELVEVSGKTRRVRQNTHYLEVKLNGITRTFKSIDTTGMSDPKIPKLFLKGKFTIPFEKWEQAIRVGRNVADHLIITMNKSRKLTINAEGYEDTLTNEIPYKELENVKGVTEDFRSLYPEDYLYSTVKQGRMKRLLKGSSLTMSMNNDYPIMMEVSNEKLWELTYLLAPRIESE